MTKKTRTQSTFTAINVRLTEAATKLDMSGPKRMTFMTRMNVVATPGHSSKVAKHGQKIIPKGEADIPLRHFAARAASFYFNVVNV
ncbi:MAG: hypothetical protein ACR2H4_04920 [Pyrinomonadaceae bacterium]